MSRRITALNNAGIKNLRGGHSKEAILCFRHAVECTRAGVAPSSFTTDSFAATNNNESSFYELPIQSVSVKHIDSKVILESSPHNAFDVYQCAFLFPKVESLASYQTEISIVLFYNIAVAHQLAALSNVAHAASNMKEALRFYKLALNLFRSIPDLNFETSCYALVLGILTNMGFIFSHSWRTAEANSCSEHLEELLNSSAVAELSEEDLDFFFPPFTACYGQNYYSCSLAPAA